MIDILMIVMCILAIVLICLSVGFILVEVSDNAIYNKKKCRIRVSLKNIINTYCITKDYSECIHELEIIFKEIISTDERLKSKYTNVVSLIESHVMEVNAEEIVWENQEIDINAYKGNIQEFLREYNKRNPLEQIKGTDYVVLKQLIECLERKEEDKGKEIVNQVAIEMKMLQDTVWENEKNSRRQDAISKIGIILSCIFGVMTFVQFFV